MYYIETCRDDGYHKYIASMTGAVVKGRELDEGVYQFEKFGDCDRAVQAINKVYGFGNSPIVIGKTIGGEKSKEPKPAKSKEMEQTIPKKAETPKATSPKSRTPEAAQLAIIRKLVSKPTSPAQNPLDVIKTKAGNDIPLSNIMKAVAKPQSKVVNKPTKEIAPAGEIDLDDAENIGMEQYALDESGGDF